MKDLSRRDVLCGMGHAAAFGALTAVLPRDARAAEQAQGDGVAICLSMLYPSGKKFDADRYRDKHLPLIKSVYGAALRRIEVNRGRTGQGGSRTLMTSASHLYIRDRTAFDAAGTKAGMQLFQETANYTDIRGVFIIEKVHAAA